MRSFTLIALRGAVVALLLPFTTAASCDGGYRDATGGCPDDEVCSTKTPQGLHFRGGIIGEGFFDPGEVKTTALGGTQDVRIEMEDDTGGRTPFELPHDVVTDNANFAIEGAMDDKFRLRAMAEGESKIRIVDPATGELFDRVVAQALPIASAATQMSVNVMAATFASADPNRLYAPGATGYIRLAAANDYTLVDTSSHITGAGVTQTGWDRFSVGDLPVGPHSLTVVAGTGMSFAVPFDVALPDNLTGGPSSVIQGDTTLACFVARKGTLPVHSRFDSITSAQAVIAPTAYDGCVDVTAPDLDPVTIHVTSSGIDADFVMTVRAPIAPLVTAPSDDVRGGTAGERAALLVEE